MKLIYFLVYLVPIDRKNIFCLGYYDRAEFLKFIEYYINRFEFKSEDINEIIRSQSEIFYVI